MKGKPIDEVVFDHLFPRPKPGEPQNFQALLQRNLIPEVRQETHSFYGHLDTQEAKYPGLDYSHPTHRMRLSRWPWHRRLFRAFDSLRLTRSEIATLTKREGTKWAKEKYEKEQGVIIRDTTADGFPDVDEPAPWRRSPQPARSTVSPPRYHTSSQVRDDTPTRTTRPTAATTTAREDPEAEDEAEESEDEREMEDDEEEEEEEEGEEYFYEEALGEEVGVESLDFKNWERRTGIKRQANSTGVSLPGHSDRKELLGRIGCEKQVE